MAYLAPRTWVTGELVTATIMNTYVRDNQLALKDPPTDLYNVDEGANYTTASTSFADVDATDLAQTITTTGGDVWIWFSGSVYNASGGITYFNIHESVAGTQLIADDGLCSQYSLNTTESVSFVYLAESLTAASHTFKLQWKVSANTSTLWAGAGTGGADLHPQFGVREVS